MTVYNREAFLAEALNSILKSGFTDFEVIVVDDNSGDGSLSIAQQFEAEDRRLRAFANERNLGQFENRVRAASLANGKYIKYVDSDDILYPHSLGIMVEAMETFPEAALALSHSEAEAESPYPLLLEPAEAYKRQFLGRGCLSSGPSGAIISRRHFEDLGGFDSSWGVLSDIELWVRIAARWPVVLLPPGLVWWRRHDGQDFTKGDASIVYLQRGYEMEITRLSSDNCPLSEDNRNEAKNRRRQHFARRLLSLALRRHQIATAIRIFRGSDLSFMDLARGFLPYQ